MRIIEPRKHHGRSRKKAAPPTEDNEDDKQSKNSLRSQKLHIEEVGKTHEPLPKGKKRRRSEISVLSETQSSERFIDQTKKEFNKLFSTGVRLLAMREHSVKEITCKLQNRNESVDLVHAVVDQLIQNKYLSDERFAESYVRSRRGRGFGPIKIRAELKAKGIVNSLIQDYLEESSSIWYEVASAQYEKKFGNSPVIDYSVWSKRARFMQSRGFTAEQLQSSIPEIFAE